MCKNYKGVIIEESLSDKSLLRQVRIIETKVERVTKKHQTPRLRNWTLRTVEIPEEKAQHLAGLISELLDYSRGSAWYADFKNEKYHYIIFKDKVFKIERSKPRQYQAASEYGISLGIPSYQIDFSPVISKWER